MPNLQDVLPSADDLLALQPEQLGAIVLQLFEDHQQRGMISLGGYLSRPYPTAGGGSAYDRRKFDEVQFALAEAFAWLESQFLIMPTPDQPATWRSLTRTGRAAIQQDPDLSTFKRGHLLPRDVLHPRVVARVLTSFRAGDYDIAVFQAFREVEIATRDAANRKGANYRADDTGPPLMRMAFHPQNGPLSDQGTVTAEREGLMHMFAGAMGHGRNPPGHRDVNLSPVQAAQLIILASYLLSVVDVAAARP